MPINIERIKERNKRELHRAHVNFQRIALARDIPLGSYTDLKTREVITYSTQLECPSIRGEHYTSPVIKEFLSHWLPSADKFHVRPNFWTEFEKTVVFMAQNKPSPHTKRFEKLRKYYGGK